MFGRHVKRTHGSKPMGPLVQTLLTVSGRYYNCVITSCFKVQPILHWFSANCSDVLHLMRLKMMLAGSVILKLCPFQPSLQKLFFFLFIPLEALTKLMSGLFFVLMALLSHNSYLSAICFKFHLIKECEKVAHGQNQEKSFSMTEMTV